MKTSERAGPYSALIDINVSDNDIKMLRKMVLQKIQDNSQHICKHVILHSRIFSNTVYVICCIFNNEKNKEVFSLQSKTTERNVHILSNRDYVPPPPPATVDTSIGHSL